MRQKGFILIAGVVTIALLSLALAGVGTLYKRELNERARIEAEYESFKIEVKRLGELALKENARLLNERERIANDRIQSLSKRAADAAARADRLCKSAGLSAGCRALPPVPETTRPTDAAEFNSRLLEVLRHAQTVADQLAELQLWVQAQQEAR